MKIPIPIPISIPAIPKYSFWLKNTGTILNKDNNPINMQKGEIPNIYSAISWLNEYLFNFMVYIFLKILNDLNGLSFATFSDTYSTPSLAYRVPAIIPVPPLRETRLGLLFFSLEAF